MNRLIFGLLAFSLLFVSAPAFAQTESSSEKEGKYDLRAVIKDLQGKKLEGYLQRYPKAVTVTTKDNQEKSIPLHLIESIKVEKVERGLPGADQAEGEVHYSVNLKNSQEIFTLRKKVTLNFVTSVGVETKTIDPEMAQDFLRRDPSSAAQHQSQQPPIRDKSVIFGLELKF